MENIQREKRVFMKKKMIMLCIITATLILEILPYGAVCNFANTDGGPWRQTFSYFSLVPFGYANFAPFIVALLTCALFCFVLLKDFFKNTPISTKQNNAQVKSATIKGAKLAYPNGTKLK